MKEHTVRGHYHIVRGLIPIIFNARGNEYDKDKLIGTYSMNGDTVLDYVVDLKLIFERTLACIERIHGTKRTDRLHAYLDGRPITSYYWWQRRELRMDLRLLSKRIRAGGYAVKD